MPASPLERAVLGLLVVIQPYDLAKARPVSLSLSLSLSLARALRSRHPRLSTTYVPLAHLEVFGCLIIQLNFPWLVRRARCQSLSLGPFSNVRAS